MKRILPSLFAVSAALPLAASVVVITTPVSTVIPDDSSTGLFCQVEVTDLGTVNSVTVSLNVSAAGGSTAFVGDLYAYLQHDSGLSVLVNRPGKRTGESFGYDDNQSVGITLSDAAAADVHSYRTTLSGNDTTPLTGALTGTWKPDGRPADPGVVLASDIPAASALLSVFNGENSHGNWRLFIADLSGGAIHQFDSWELTVDFTPMTAVPEPRDLAIAVALGLVAFGVMRRGKR